MATGVLVIGVGNATKLMQYIVDGAKSYDATIALGAATHTDDKEGDLIFTADPVTVSRITEDQIRTELKNLLAQLSRSPAQSPPSKLMGKQLISEFVMEKL